MGIFTRLRDIVTSNINAMLEKAENPEKLLKLMLQEMEDTLIEIKAQCAAAMAQSKTLERQTTEARDRADQWEAKARLAVEKQRDDLAREALLEKRRYVDRADSIDVQKTECDALIEHYQNDIVELEAKMASVREKQKILVQRHEHAHSRRRAQTNIRKADSTDVFTRFESFERRIDRMEAEADLVNYGRKPTLEQAFSDIEGDEQLEAELKRLRRETKGGGKTVES
ncbi:phage shock protein PspA [Candidatus Sumerlaeota bacterium]|nr:phage shock protein PspA [Candidatus Sumerlaeota bacterium]